MRILFGGVAMAIALLVACSSSDDASPKPAGNPDGGSLLGGDGGGPTSQAGEKNQAQACTTVTRNFTVAPVDYYHVFPSDQVAVDTMNELNGYKFIAPGSAEQMRGEKAVAKIFAAYQKLYPNAVAGMTEPPRVIINDTTAFNAFAFSIPLITEGAGKPDTTPWVFVFNKGFFLEGITDDMVTAVAAHELGHLILRNGNADYFQHVYYRETPDEAGKIYGEYEANDADIQTLLVDVKEIGARVGQAAAKELHGVPTDFGADAIPGIGFSDPLYFRILNIVYQQFKATSQAPAQCTEANKQYATLNTVVQNHKTPDNTLVLGSDAAAVDAAALAFSTAMEACLGHVTGTYVDAATLLKKAEDPNFATTYAAVKDNPQKLASYLDLSKNEIDADTQQPTQNIVPKLLGLGQKAQDALMFVYTDAGVKYEELREFTQEDDADEAAVRTSKLMGIDSDNLANALFIAHQSTGDALWVTACKNTLASGNAPKYGGVVDVHHGDCWRAYRNSKLKMALQSCPATWPAK